MRIKIIRLIVKLLGYEWSGDQLNLPVWYVKEKRKNKPTVEIVEEIADILIRTLDIYAALQNHGWVEDSLDEILDQKVNINKSRPRLHGNRF